MSEPEFYVILAEPQNPGNIGAVARSMKNFSVRNLILVKPPPIDDEARRRAMHGNDVLDNAKIVNTFDEAIAEMDYLAATSGVTNVSDKRHLRNPISPRKFANDVYELSGKIGLVFGRENFGLYVEELEKCDVVVTIPANPEYPIMNLSHAATVVLYELYVDKHPARELRHASGFEKQKLQEKFEDMLDAIDYAKHRREGTSMMWKRLMGRAMPSKWEFSVLMGVFGRAATWARLARDKGLEIQKKDEDTKE